MMTVQFTCPHCGSGIHVLPEKAAEQVHCDVCKGVMPVRFTEHQEQGLLHDCPSCGRKDFYQQKDFNRKVGVSLFVLAAIIGIFTYGIGLIVLYLFDLLLFRKLGSVAVCYKCQAIFRKVVNISEINGFNHEMSDRIVYQDHDFQGRPLEH